MIISIKKLIKAEKDSTVNDISNSIVVKNRPKMTANLNLINVNQQKINHKNEVVKIKTNELDYRRLEIVKKGLRFNDLDHYLCYNCFKDNLKLKSKNNKETILEYYNTYKDEFMKIKEIYDAIPEITNKNISKYHLRCLRLIL